LRLYQVAPFRARAPGDADRFGHPPWGAAGRDRRALL